MTPITDRIAAMNLPIPHGEEFMQPVTIAQINESLLKLPPEKLVVVYDFISYLTERDLKQVLMTRVSDSFQTMLASEDVLRRDWDLPEEDEAWADL